MPQKKVIQSQHPLLKLVRHTRARHPASRLHITCTSIIFGSLLLLPFLLMLGHNYVQSFTDFFISGNKSPLSSIYAWQPTNFGSNATGEIWRIFPLGTLYYIFNYLLSFPPGLFQALFLASLFTVSYISFTKLVRYTLRLSSDDFWAVRLGGLLYVYNTYSLTQLSSSFLLVIPYLILPLQLLILYHAATNKNLTKYVIYLSLLNLSVFGVNLIFDIISLVALCFFGGVYAWSEKFKLRRLAVFILSSVSLTLILSSFWLVPLAYSGLIDQKTTHSVLQSEDFYNNDSSIQHVLRGLGDWGFFGSNNGIPYNTYSSTYRSNALVIIAGYFFSVIAIVPLVLVKKTHTKKWQIIAPFYGLLILMLPFIGGTNNTWPTHSVIQALFDHIPYFKAFRNTYKFATIELLCVSVILVFALLILSNRIRSNRNKKYFILTASIISLAMILINAFPFFTGKIVQPGKNIQKVPPYWNQATQYINTKLSPKDRIFLLPDEYFEIFNWSGKMQSFPRDLEQTTLKPSVVHDTCKGCAQYYTGSYLNYVYNNLEDPSIFSILGMTGVTYVLQRNDYDYPYYKVQPPSQIETLLANKQNLKLVKTFGSLDLYKVDQKYTYPPLYSPKFIAQVSKNSELPAVVSKNGHLGVLATTQTSQLTPVDDKSGPHSSLYKTIFDLDETVVKNGTATNSLTISSNNTYSLGYSNPTQTTQANYRLSYAYDNGQYFLVSQLIQNEINVDGKNVFQPTSTPAKRTYLGSYNSQIALRIGDQAYLLKPSGDRNLGAQKLDSQKTTLYVYDTAGNLSSQLINNGSLESGLWQKKVEDCQKNTYKANISMQWVMDASDGARSLSLTATQDTACIHTPEIQNFQSGLYIFSFDSKNISGHAPSYCVWDGKGCVKASNVASTKNWSSRSDVTYIDKAASNFYLYLYAQKGNYSKTVNRYDNVKIQRFNHPTNVINTNLAIPPAPTVKLSLSKGQHVISSKIVKGSANLVDNGSFEHGLWSQNASGCHKTEGTSTEARLDKSASSGKSSLYLYSENDIACISSSSLQYFTRDTTYLLTFDYKISQGGAAQYCVWDGNKCIAYHTIQGAKNTWQTYQTIVKPTRTSRTFIIYFYADGTKSPSHVNYDDVRVSTIDNNFTDVYALTSSAKDTFLPATVRQFQQQSPTHYTANIIIKGESPLVLQQAYHAGWKIKILRSNDSLSLLNRLGFGRSYLVPSKDHFVANSVLNGWWIDSAEIPSNYRQADESYNVVIEYTPQYYVYGGIGIGIFSILCCLSYLGRQRWKKREHFKGWRYVGPR